MLCWKIGKKLFNLSFKRVPLLFFVWAPLCDAKAVVDAMQTQVILVDRPVRIVTLAPSLGELTADLLGQEMSRIVGVSEYTDYPPQLKKISSIGPYNRFNLEKVFSLKPDLVLATVDGNSRDQITHLRELGIPIVAVSTENFEQIEESIRLVGQSIGNSKYGEQMALQLKSGLKRFEERAKNRTSVSVMVQIGDQPLIVAGGKTFLDSGLSLIGAKNIYSKSNPKYPRPSIEDVLRLDPDVIVVAAMGENLSFYQQMVKKWNQFPSLKAVKTHRIYLLKSDALLRPTLRILEGLSVLEKTIYGK